MNISLLYCVLILYSITYYVWYGWVGTAIPLVSHSNVPWHPTCGRDEMVDEKTDHKTQWQLKSHDEHAWEPPTRLLADTLSPIWSLVGGGGGTTDIDVTPTLHICENHNRILVHMPTPVIYLEWWSWKKKKDIYHCESLTVLLKVLARLEEAG